MILKKMTDMRWPKLTMVGLVANTLTDSFAMTLDGFTIVEAANDLSSEPGGVAWNQPAKYEFSTLHKVVPNCWSGVGRLYLRVFRGFKGVSQRERSYNLGISWFLLVWIVLKYVNCKYVTVFRAFVHKMFKMSIINTNEE
jgi:hypothetical protein